MTKEDKELLLRDLCARLPYGVICQYNCVIPCGRITLEKTNARDVLKGIIPMPDGHIGFMVGIDKVDALEGDIKPYLRPMDSMTKEEKEELKQLSYEYLEEWGNAQTPIDKWKLDAKISYNTSVFYNSHHLDWNGLIEKGLALEALKGMYEKGE